MGLPKGNVFFIVFFLLFVSHDIAECCFQNSTLHTTFFSLFKFCFRFFLQETPWPSAVEQDIFPLLQLEVSSEWFHLAPRDIHFVGRRKLLVMDSRSLTAYSQNGYRTTATLTTALTRTTALLTAAILTTALLTATTLTTA
jgi:hypothetical protein